MSYTVRAATLAATSASISTPVAAVVVTFEAMATPFSHSSARTSMCVSGRGWHMGISSAVRLAALMPAMRAISRGLPLGFAGSAFTTRGAMATKALASAWRLVAALADTSTMEARPRES